ncbi:hypothetical protein K470DRAFT_217853 [Piedraia hortae CBS 480.64]|uniref:YDG domain-containing protein n=1 Tax=Piedraia hortae CBS 480.64 TaxID=1314780 RepID=A0A6A7BYF7_9PEZI|nr:hypothetical protein K470DRAFT_217853 [Piedraia hortae CBS 480.64]
MQIQTQTHSITIHVDNRSSSPNLRFLQSQARWIRDELDPQIAINGPDALHSDEILKLDDLLRTLQDASLTITDLKTTRIHLAVLLICSQGTRWPRRLIDRSDQLTHMWERKFQSPLKDIGILLYEPGGRLHGVCQPNDIDEEALINHWRETNTLGGLFAKQSGSLRFRPGDWWISPLFAYRAGIISTPSRSGGIISDPERAYAILMTDDSELCGPNAEEFFYRAADTDRGKFSLTSATPESRTPVRILRSHTLRSFHAPKAGVRYDGLYRVTGWRVLPDEKTKKTKYEIGFKRLENEPSMSSVLRRPTTDEVEDYTEYKRLRRRRRRRGS